MHALRTRTILIKILIIYLNFIIINLKSAQTYKVVKGACENFYEYACSNYSRENPDPNYSEIIQKLDYEMNIKLLSLIEEKRKASYRFYKQSFYDKIRLYLKSCENERQRNLKKYFKEFKPSGNFNWPLLEETLEFDIFNNLNKFAHDAINKFKNSLGIGPANKTFEFWSLLGEMQSYGLNNVIVNHQIMRNKDNSLNILLAPAFLEEGGSLPDSTILRVLLQALGIEETEPIIQQLNITDFEWLNLTQNYAEATESKQLTLKDITKHYPGLRLKSYFKNLLGSELNNRLNITLENSQYFEYLNQKQWTTEDLEYLCNYLMMKFLYYLAEDSTAEYTSLECIKDLRRKFDLAVNYVYFENFDKREVEQYDETMGNMWFIISSVMTKLFEENYLNLSEKQVTYLKTKLSNIKLNRGNLPNACDFYSIRDFYQNLPNMHANNYYKNHLLLLQHRFRQSLYYAPNQTYFLVTDNRMGSVSSPYYVPQQNMVVIPFGSLQSPFFNYSQTPLQQLSLFGFVLAHELTHALDTTGLNYDKQGLPSSSGSDIMDHVNFSNSLECMQHQQPTEEIDERIADLFAVRAAYNTYLKYYSKAHKEDWRQEFFMSLAQFFCGKDDINFIEHDADNIRLHQILMNFQPFSEAFGCAEGSPMNPETKCRLY